MPIEFVAANHRVGKIDQITLQRVGNGVADGIEIRNAEALPMPEGGDRAVLLEEVTRHERLNVGGQIFLRQTLELLAIQNAFVGEQIDAAAIAIVLV